MADAQVEFLNIDATPCAEGQTPQRFSFRCVGYNRNRDPRFPVEKCAALLIADSGHGIKRDGQGQNGGRPQWNWDGNKTAPTFTPSINCEGYCGWHGYIRNGRTVETDGSDSK